MPLLNDQPLNGLEVEEVLATLATFLIPYVAYYIRKFVAAHVSAKQQSVLSSLASIAAHGAEELAHKAAKADEDVPGSAKLEKASVDLAFLARGRGIKLSEREAKTLIEGVLNRDRPYMTEPDLDAVLEAVEPEPGFSPESYPVLEPELREPADADGSRPV